MTRSMGLRRRCAIKPFDSAPTPSDFGTHIGDWFAQPGDVAYYVRNGSTLDGDNIDFTTAYHDVTTGTYNGWIPIMCQTQGGSTLDLSDPRASGGLGGYSGGLDLRYTSTSIGGLVHLPLRIMLGGFHIKFGQIIPQWINRFRFWHCTFENPPDAWQSYYDRLYFFAHGSHPIPNPSTHFDSSVFGPSVNWHPTMIGMDECFKDNGEPDPMGGRSIYGMEIYFSDFQGIGDDAWYATSSNIWHQGVRFDDIYHHGINYFNPDTGGDLIHSDVIQAAGTNVEGKNVSWGGHLDWEGTGAGSVGVNVDNWWQYGSSISAFGFGTDGSHNVNGTLTNGASFCNGQYYHDGVNPATQSTPFYDGPSDRLLDDYDPAGLTWDGGSATTWKNAHYNVKPSGVVTSGGLISPDLTTPLPGTYPSVPSIFNNVNNVALIDQLANPYSSWSTFFDRTVVNNPSAGVYGWT